MAFGSRRTSRSIIVKLIPIAVKYRNAGSAVLHLQGAGLNVLVGGDAQDGIWRRLITSGRLPQADTFRCSHHGGSTGPNTGAALSEVLATVRPREVIVSVGTNNQHGHPLAAVVGAARLSGARVMCTEATAQCHPALTGSVQCAGDIVLSTATAGTGYTISPDPLTHHKSIVRLNQPLCAPPAL